MLKGMKGLIVFCVVLVCLTGIILGVRYLGMCGETRIERKVFEESYQRSEAMKARIATDEATLVEIEAQLARSDLDADTRANLEAQARAARVRIRAAKAQQ